MENKSMSIADIFSILKAHIKLLIIITMVTTGLAVFISYFIITPKYEASTKLFIGKTEVAGSSYNQSDVIMYQKLMKTYSEIAKTKDLVSDALKKVNSSDDETTALGKLSVVPSNDTQILKITFKDADPVYAAAVVSAITNEFIHKSNILIKDANITIIEKVTVPEEAISPNKRLNVMVGFILGVFLALMIIYLGEFLKNTFKNKKEIEEYLDIAVLGVIPLFDNNSTIYRNKKLNNERKKRKSK